MTYFDVVVRFSNPKLVSLMLKYVNDKKKFFITSIIYKPLILNTNDTIKMFVYF